MRVARCQLGRRASTEPQLPELIAATKLIYGPNSTELAFHIGRVKVRSVLLRKHYGGSGHIMFETAGGLWAPTLGDAEIRRAQGDELQIAGHADLVSCPTSKPAHFVATQALG